MKKVIFEVRNSVGDCVMSSRGSFCLHASKPTETGTGVCSKGSRGSFKEIAPRLETQVS